MARPPLPTDSRGAAVARLLERPLPGVAAHLTMLPAVRQGTYPATPPATARRGSVLVVLLPARHSHDGGGSAGRHDPPARARGAHPAASVALAELDLLFIERTDDGGPHGGQIALPGGRAEPEDADEYETALREAEEEIGIDREACIPLGSLTPFFVAVSNYVVTPIVAWYTGDASALPAALAPQPDEVASILRANLAEIASSRAVRVVRARGIELDAPSFLAEGHIVWGATGVIIAELLTLLERQADPTTAASR